MKINQLKISISDLKTINRTGKVNSEEMSLIRKKLCREYNIADKDIRDISVIKKSLDARKNHRLSYIYNLDVSVLSEPSSEKISVFNPYIDKNKNYKRDKNIVIIGAGPAGLFCAYILALNGFKPTLIEQGATVEERVKQVNEFWADNKKLNEYSNVTFGEGGAGTFSDGKLNTSVKDKTGKIAYIKQVFVENGAPEEILYLDKPHIGTDILRDVIVNMRKTITHMGSNIYFNTHMGNISVCDNRINSITVTDTITHESREIPCDRLVLAIGHSSGKTYRMLKDKLSMSCKDFAVGFRVSHLQELIDKCQYGRDHYKLPAADYKLRYHTDNDRTVYSFCMCPGGYVVNSSTETGKTVVNGMSDHARNSEYANSAIVVNVCAGKDYDDSDPLAGVAFQEKLEKTAYSIGVGKIPVQSYGDYRNDNDPDYTDEYIHEHSSVKGECTPANLRRILPGELNDSIIEAMGYFDNVIPGFADDEVMMCGVESRTSSPVRIPRDETLQSDVRYIFPCGEGAGYAGGITSAAADGIKCALALIDSLMI